MADYRGIFSLQQLYEEQQSDNWAIAEESSFTKPPYNLNWYYGYQGGGHPSASLGSGINRIDFSNDDVQASRRGNLSNIRYGGAATGNATYSYYSLGILVGHGPATTVTDRIDYANDTGAVAPKGNATVQGYYLQATSTPAYGWFVGRGDYPTYYSRVDRIDFASDSTTFSTRGNLAINQYAQGVTGNQTYAWSGGGSKSGTRTSEVNRIQYSTDTSTASPKGPLTAAKYSFNATGNNDYGWWGGGYTTWPTAISVIDRIDYSNDTAIASARSNLPYSTGYISATGNRY